MPSVVWEVPRRFTGIFTIEHTPPAWEADRTYASGYAVDVSGTLYVSLVGSNLNNPPASSPSQWQLASTLYTSQVLAALFRVTGFSGSSGTGTRLNYAEFRFHFQIDVYFPDGVPNSLTDAQLVTKMKEQYTRIHPAAIAALEARVQIAPVTTGL